MTNNPATPTEQKQHSKVFISYSRKDKDFGVKLRQYLRERGYSVWLDLTEMPLIAEVWAEIGEQIQAADNFIFITSSHSLASPSCHLELNMAIRFGKRIVPLQLDMVDESASLKTLEAAELTLFQREEQFREQSPATIGQLNWEKLPKYQWVDFKDQNTLTEDQLNARFETLCTALDTDLDYVKAHTRYLVRANEWIAGGQDQYNLLRGKDCKAARRWLRESAKKEQSAHPAQADFIRASRCIEIEAWQAVKRRKKFLEETIRTLQTTKQDLQTQTAQLEDTREQLQVQTNELQTRKQTYQKTVRWLGVLIAVLVTAASVLGVVIFKQSEFLLRRLALAAAARDRIIGSNQYLIADYAGAKTSYEDALNGLKALEPAFNGDWSVFAQPDYKGENIVVETWLEDLGKTCLQLGDQTCATEYLQQSLQVNPANTDAGLQLAELYRQQGEIQLAKDAVQSVIDHAGQDPDFLSKTLGLPIINAKIAYSDGKPDDAIRVLERWMDSLKPTPDDPDAGIYAGYYVDLLYFHGLSSQLKGDKEAACKDWNEYQATLLTTPPTLRPIGFSKQVLEVADLIKQCEPAS